MITKLTKQQEAKFPEYVAKWVDIGTSTEPTDMIATVDAIKRAYEVVKLDPPKYFIGPVAGPYEAALAEALIEFHANNNTKFANARELNERIMREIEEYICSDSESLKLSISNQIYGYQEYWLSYYDYFQNECGINLDVLKPLLDLSRVCGWWTPLEEVAIIQERPSVIKRDEQGRLHCVDGPAVAFRSNIESPSNLYSVHGVRVNKKIIDRNFTVEDIENQPNAEVRRVMIELYGQSKYLIDSNAEVVHEDDFGTLYRKEIPNDEPLMMVKVVNSTVEPDGTFKDYFIRVDEKAYGGLKTARAAVASTWRNNDAERSLIFKRPEDYDPDIET